MHTMLVLISFAFMASTVLSDQVPGMCTQADLNSGVYLKSHDTYCNLYYHCLPDLMAEVMACPEGLFFDDVSRICQRPKDAVCRSFKDLCTATTANGMWAHSCCDRYVGCRNGLFYFGKCGANMVFDRQNGACVSSFGALPASCDTNVHCLRRYVRTNIPETQCMLRAVPNEPCKFRTVAADGSDLGVQDCAEGSSFNATTCNCGNLNPECRTYTAVIIDNRRMDPQCRASMIMDFSGQVPTSYTMKTSNGQRLMNTYSIGAMGYTSGNTEGILHSDADGNKAKLYFWSYARNMLLGPFGVKMSFRVDNPREGYSFALLSNDMSSVREDCVGTLDIRATYRGGRWVITFKVIGYDTMNGQLTNVQESQTVPASNGYITLSFMLSRATKSISGYIMGQGGAPVSWGPVGIGGDQIAINSCGLAVAHGLEGRLREVRFYEACGDENILRSNMQNP